MKQRLVGQSGLRVSRLGLGTSTWGNATNIEQAEAIFRLFLSAGGTLIDSSPVYAGGNSEKLLGKILSSSCRRDDVIISSNAGVHPSLPVGQRVDCSRRSLLAQLDRTLSTLGTDYLDLWSVGYFDHNTPVVEVVDTVDYAIRTGRVRYAGTRGYSGWQLAVTAQVANPARSIICAQDEYNLLVRRVEEDLLPAADYLNLGFFAGSPLGQGVLTGKYRKGIPADSRAAATLYDAEVQGYLNSRSQTIVDALVTAAEGLKISPAQVATAWVRDRPGVSAVLVGARTLKQLEQLLPAEEVNLPQAIIQALDDVSS